ncbi:PEMT-domain-containing protein [Jaminaea rosea]|uniref:Phosphatidyl-N-methylethanolamine N-methyltransferase n=1 Tax=Jaminaea rosea TaxID=1569628 RepID=A0A316ULR7_9BASI|nr:PEMT-domain-containing protein [Jaminaea rosea]PWN26180.1 PEMT-domain-containing protein [Jaminaea rosea]
MQRLAATSCRRPCAPRRRPAHVACDVAASRSATHDWDPTLGAASAFHLLLLHHRVPLPTPTTPRNMDFLFGTSKPKSAYTGLVDFSQPSLYIAAASIAFNPTFWNIVAQNEYHNKTITRILGGNRYLGCYMLAFTIFSLGIIRDHLYNAALQDQPAHPLLENNPVVKALSAALFISGNVFVLSSMWALGVTGTYLGDYFGILMDHIVTGFPFNVMSDPMYWGSSMSFAGVALWFGKPAGFASATTRQVTDLRPLPRTRSPFTSQIYAAAAAKGKRSSGLGHGSTKGQAAIDDEGPAHRTRASTGTPVGNSSSNAANGGGSTPGTPSKRSTRSRKN